MPKLLMPNFDKNKTEKHIQKKEAKLNKNLVPRRKLNP
jgi:hypothetical protein